MFWIWGYDFHIVLLYVWYGLGYGLDMVLDMILIWFWYGLGTERLFQGSRWAGFEKGNRNSPRTGFWSISRGFLWFWYDFGMVLIQFWYEFDTILTWFSFDLIWFQDRSFFFRVAVGWLQKGKNNSPGTGFGQFLKGFYGFDMMFDMILIWFWCGFDAILGRFWCDSDLILICFRVIFTLLTDIKITMLTHVMSKS